MSHLIIPVNEKDHTKGPVLASVTLVEYGDYQCSLCRLSYSIAQQLMKEKELEGNLRFVFRQFPLQKSHPYALLAAQAAEAAARQHKFWEMHDSLYEHQLSLSPTTPIELAHFLDLKIEKFQQDLVDSSIQEKIQEDFKMGVRSGVNGLPCLFINGTRYDGDSSYQSLKHFLILLK